MSETHLVRSILEALWAHGIWAKRHNGGTRNHRQMGLGAGCADIIACVGGRMICLEVKLPKQKPRPEQQAWLKEVESHGANVAVVTSVSEALKSVNEFRRSV